MLKQERDVKKVTRSFWKKKSLAILLDRQRVQGNAFFFLWWLIFFFYDEPVERADAKTAGGRR
jgi:hypothetical protein